MTKEQDWSKITYLRKTIKDGRSKITKDRHGNKIGGNALTDIELKPYREKLADLEAKMAKDKERMSTGERVDTGAQEVMAQADSNHEEMKEHVSSELQSFLGKLNPNKFKTKVNKWAYIAAKGSGDYYRYPDGKVFPRLGDIPPSCTFCHKVRVIELIDTETDTYKFCYEDGKPGIATGRSQFMFISLVGSRVHIKKNCNLPKTLEKFAGDVGTIVSEPSAERPERDNDMFEISFGKTRRKARRQFLNFSPIRTTI